MNSWKIVPFLSLFTIFPGDALWTKFATSDVYRNLRLVFESNAALLLTKPYPVSLSDSKLSCAQECSKNAPCQAFNFYLNGTQYICELLTDNICLKDGGKLTLQVQAQGAVYDKLQAGVTQTCLERAFANASASQWCSTARPGCTGTWPNCNFCAKTCTDCNRVFNYSGSYDCTLWPEGPSSTPIFAHCSNQLTKIISKWVDTNTGVFSAYTMPFKDVNRITNLKVYPMLQLYSQVNYPFAPYSGYYSFSSIDADGTISNLTFLGNIGCNSCIDGLQLGPNVLTLAPFVWVSDPHSNCGSFWLIRSSNPLNCPGGGVIDLLGKVQQDGAGKVTDSGIHLANVTVMLGYAEIGLMVF